MAIECTTPQAQVDAYIAERIEAFNRAAIRAFCYCGEMCLNAARSTKSYKDQTGNLRSSLGYVVVADGKIVSESGFQQVKDGKDGTDAGAEYAKELARKTEDGIVLIVVAGMNYAQYVSAKGYDVIDSAELLAQQVVPQILKNLGFSD